MFQLKVSQMKKNNIIIAGSLLATVPFVGCNNIKEKHQESPNVIVILADDMGYGDIKALNLQAKTITPNLDKLVNEGVNFTDAHTNSAVCTPTRYGILTGRYCFRSRLKKGVLSGYDKSLIEPGRATLAHLFEKRDYNTACIGKWHLGLDWKRNDPSAPLVEGGGKYNPSNTHNVDYTKSVNGGPADHGFDHEYILPASLDMPPYLFVKDQKVEDLPSRTLKHFRDSTCRGVLYRNGDASPNFSHNKVLQHIVDKSKNYISKNVKKDKPFFLYLPLTAPHTPWMPDEKFIGKSGAGLYGDFICMVDDMIGQINAELVKQGIDKNTIIIFTSDNGSHWKEEEKNKYHHLANADKRGMKSDLYDGGHRVPFIVKWPNHFPKGDNCDEVICTTDIFATCADILNVPVQKGEAEDSRSFLSYLLNPDKALSDTPVMHHSVNGEFALRVGKWKFIDCSGSGGWSETSPLNKTLKLPVQLYDVKADVYETTNVANEYPEVVEMLRNQLEEIKAKK